MVEVIRRHPSPIRFILTREDDECLTQPAAREESETIDHYYAEWS